MKNIEITIINQHETYILGNKAFSFDPKIKIETYQCDSYYGIVFIVNGTDRYDVVHHYHMDWERLVINNKEGWKDLPFYSGTFHMLPEGVKVIEL